MLYSGNSSNMLYSSGYIECKKMELILAHRLPQNLVNKVLEALNRCKDNGYWHEIQKSDALLNCTESTSEIKRNKLVKKQKEQKDLQNETKSENAEPEESFAMDSTQEQEQLPDSKQETLTKSSKQKRKDMIWKHQRVTHDQVEANQSEEEIQDQIQCAETLHCDHYQDEMEIFPSAFGGECQNLSYCEYKHVQRVNCSDSALPEIFKEW